MLQLEQSDAWDILSGHISWHIEHCRDMLEIQSEDDELHRGMITAFRGVLDFPASRITAAQEFINREDSK